MRNRPSFIAAALLWLSVATSPSAFAWGCRGHQSIVLIALQYMTPAHVAATNALLDKFPSPIALSCTDTGLPAAARESTWADDYRFKVKTPDTAGWHFLDLPVTGPANLTALCAKGCVSNALPDNIATFRKNTDNAAGADALRFILHLTGDAHQPLHEADNHDRGGNCIPVAFPPKHKKSTRKVDAKGVVSYDPELHSVWDKYMIDDEIGSSAVTDYAGTLGTAAKANRDAWTKFDAAAVSGALVTEWAKEAHQFAVTVSYANLVAGPRGTPVSLADIAGPADLMACSDHNFQDMIAARKIAVSADYGKAALPVVHEQLEKAGVRLAAILDALWASAGK